MTHANLTSMPSRFVASLNRRSIRLADYDYSSNGSYFVTITALPEVPALAELSSTGISDSSVGRLVRACWNELPRRFDAVSADAFSIQPNHVHGIIKIGLAADVGLSEIVRVLSLFRRALSTDTWDDLVYRYGSAATTSV